MTTNLQWESIIAKCVFCGRAFLGVELDEGLVRQVQGKMIEVPIEGRLTGLGIEGVRARRLGEPMPCRRIVKGPIGTLVSFNDLSNGPLHRAGHPAVVFGEVRKKGHFDHRLFLFLLAQIGQGFALREVGCRNDLFLHLLGLLCFSVSALLVTF